MKFTTRTRSYGDRREKKNAPDALMPPTRCRCCVVRRSRMRSHVRMLRSLDADTTCASPARTASPTTRALCSLSVDTSCREATSHTRTSPARVKGSVSRTSYRSNVEREARVKSVDGKRVLKERRAPRERGRMGSSLTSGAAGDEKLPLVRHRDARHAVHVRVRQRPEQRAVAVAEPAHVPVAPPGEDRPGHRGDAVQSAAHAFLRAQRPHRHTLRADAPRAQPPVGAAGHEPLLPAEAVRRREEHRRHRRDVRLLVAHALRRARSQRLQGDDVLVSLRRRDDNLVARRDLRDGRHRALQRRERLHRVHRRRRALRVVHGYGAVAAADEVGVLREAEVLEAQHARRVRLAAHRDVAQNASVDRELGHVTGRASRVEHRRVRGELHGDVDAALEAGAALLAAEQSALRVDAPDDARLDARGRERVVRPLVDRARERHRAALLRRERAVRDDPAGSRVPTENFAIRGDAARDEDAIVRREGETRDALVVLRQPVQLRHRAQVPHDDVRVRADALSGREVPTAGRHRERGDVAVVPAEESILRRVRERRDDDGGRDRVVDAVGVVRVRLHRADHGRAAREGGEGGGGRRRSREDEGGRAERRRRRRARKVRSIRRRIERRTRRMNRT
eukprot:31353-Pelagococcus_subviridis.AAC.3